MMSSFSTQGSTLLFTAQEECNPRSLCAPEATHHHPHPAGFPRGPCAQLRGGQTTSPHPPTVSLGPAATGGATQTSCILGDLSGEDDYVCVCVGGGMCVLVTQLCSTLCNTMYRSPPASSIHGIIHSRKLEWVAMPSSRRSS